jgi:hypothetical protein
MAKHARIVHEIDQRRRFFSGKCDAGEGIVCEPETFESSAINTEQPSETAESVPLFLPEWQAKTLMHSAPISSRIVFSHGEVSPHSTLVTRSLVTRKPGRLGWASAMTGMMMRRGRREACPAILGCEMQGFGVWPAFDDELSI